MYTERRVDIKFPCGYRYKDEMIIKIGLLDFFSAKTSDDELPVCPIHDKKCK